MASGGPEEHAQAGPAVADGPENHHQFPIVFDPIGYGWADRRASEAFLNTSAERTHALDLIALTRAGGLAVGAEIPVGGGYRLVVQGPEGGVPAVEGAAPAAPVEQPAQPAPAEQPAQPAPGQVVTQEQLQQAINQLNQNFEYTLAWELAHQENQFRDLQNQWQQERQQFQQDIADRDAQIAALQAQIQALQGGPGPGPVPANLQPLTPDELQQLHTEIEGARNDLVDITIRRKSRTWFDRWLPWRRGESQEYENALARYTGLVEQMRNHERAYRLSFGHNEADVVQGQEDEVYEDLNNLAQEVYDQNRDRVRDIIENGNFFRRNWARATWFWGNRPWWQKGLAVLGVGAGVALVSATAGLGLAFIGAGAGLKFSVSYFNNRSGVRNLAHTNLEREQARIQQAHQALQQRRAGMTIVERRAQMNDGFRNTHEGNIGIDRRWNTFGKVACVGGGLVTLVSVIDIPAPVNMRLNWGFLRGVQPWDSGFDGNGNHVGEPNTPTPQPGPTEQPTTPKPGLTECPTPTPSPTDGGPGPGQHREFLHEGYGHDAVAIDIPNNTRFRPDINGATDLVDLKGRVLVDDIQFRSSGSVTAQQLRDFHSQFPNLAFNQSGHHWLTYDNYNPRVGKIGAPIRHFVTSIEIAKDELAEAA